MPTTRRVRQIRLTASLISVLGVLLLAGEGTASKGHPLKVRGEVVAVNVEDTPNVIVLRSVTPRNEESIVGAAVNPGVRITRGSRRVTLSEIQVGESVDLVYVKTLEGLVARSIHAR